MLLICSPMVFSCDDQGMLNKTCLTLCPVTCLPAYHLKTARWSCSPCVLCPRLKGGYRSLDMGFPHEAMVDMTGGVAEVLKIASLPRDLPTFLRYLLSKGALINCFNCQVQWQRYRTPEVKEPTSLGWFRSLAMMGNSTAEHVPIDIGESCCFVCSFCPDRGRMFVYPSPGSPGKKEWTGDHVQTCLLSDCSRKGNCL